MLTIVKGDLIKLALAGEFDVIAHGCNCFCRMKRGIAVEMAKNFKCDRYPMEHKSREGDINKLGNIESEMHKISERWIYVVNMYTQYHWSNPGPGGIPLNYSALAMCLQKLNRTFKGKHIGLPWIGCGLAKGEKMIVEDFIKTYLKDCKVTIVEYDKEI